MRKKFLKNIFIVSMLIFFSCCSLVGKKKIEFKESVSNDRVYVYMYVDGQSVGYLSRAEESGLVKKYNYLKELLKKKDGEAKNKTLLRLQSEVLWALNYMTKDLKLSFNSFVMLGNLYIEPKFRGKGFAKKLVKNVCDRIALDKKIKYIGLIAGPYEKYGTKEQVIEMTDPEYQQKRDGLIRLYSTLGFFRIPGHDVMVSKIAHV